MSISFEESLKKMNQQNTSMPLSLKNNSRMLMTTSDEIAVSDDWILDNSYEYYPEYSDINASIVDNNKNITLAADQINLSQETNSQFIPFEMPRYYDGFDLKNTNILFYFVNQNKHADYANPINVYYNDSKIKFGWLVDERVTYLDGVVRFEIQAIGTNSKGNNYVWKTKPCDGLNILKSLSGTGVIEPDHSWISDLMIQLTDKVNLAITVAEEAKLAAEEAKNSSGNNNTLIDENELNAMLEEVLA